MRIFAALLFTAVLSLGLPAAPALAQQVQLAGAWSWQSPGSDGPDFNTIALDPSGRFVRVARLSTGYVVRMEGTFEVNWTSQTSFELKTHTLQHLPQSVCAQNVGCEPAQSDPDIDLPFVFTSPNSLSVPGQPVALYRDANPVLLQQPVPAQQIIASQVPAMPMPGMPVAPVITPYTTPDGSGEAMSNAAHQGAQDFINLYERGCSKDDQGQLYGCQQ